MPTRPSPTSPGNGGQREDVEGGLLVGMRGAHRGQHVRALPCRRDDLYPVLGHLLDDADAADRRRRAFMRQELSDAGGAPAAMRIVADVPRACGEHPFPHRIGVLRGHEDDPLVEVGSDRNRRQHLVDASARTHRPARRTPREWPRRRWYVP